MYWYESQFSQLHPLKYTTVRRKWYISALLFDEAAGDLFRLPTRAAPYSHLLSFYSACEDLAEGSPHSHAHHSVEVHTLAHISHNKTT